MGEPREYGGGVVYEPKAHLDMLEELWGPPPWEISIGELYGREVMERVRAVTLDGVRFVRHDEPDWDGMEVTD